MYSQRSNAAGERLRLTELERHNLRGYLTILLEADEPRAFLGSLRRVAERKAHSFTRGKIEADECGDWLVLVDALFKIECEMSRTQSADPTDALTPLL